MAGSWDATQVESNPIPHEVNYSGLPSGITEAALGMNSNGTWEFYVNAGVPGQAPGGIGAGPMKVIGDYGTYTVQLAQNGLTLVDFASQAYPD